MKNKNKLFTKKELKAIRKIALKSVNDLSYSIRQAILDSKDPNVQTPPASLIRVPSRYRPTDSFNDSITLYGTISNPVNAKTALVTSIKNVNLHDYDEEGIPLYSLLLTEPIFDVFPTAALLVPQIQAEQKMLEIITKHGHLYIVREVDNVRYLELFNSPK